jgi:hypothetical protein
MHSYVAKTQLDYDEEANLEENSFMWTTASVHFRQKCCMRGGHSPCLSTIGMTMTVTRPIISASEG